MEQAMNEHFEQLPLARAEMPAALSGQYRVYIDATNYKHVEACSAVEAIILSGLANVVKIERESLHKSRLIMPKYSAAAGAVAEIPPAAI